MDEGNLTEKSACGFNLRYFQTETHVYIFTKNRTVRRGSPTRKPMDRWTDARGLPTVRCAEMGTSTRSGGGARAPSASTSPHAAAQATPPPPPLALPAPPALHDHGSLRSMPFAFFAAISRPRGVMDRFSGFFPEEDDWATMADDCCDMMVARRRAVGTDRALVCGTTRRRARRNARQIAR